MFSCSEETQYKRQMEGKRDPESAQEEEERETEEVRADVREPASASGGAIRAPHEDFRLVQGRTR